jgi:hypothetical protein
VAIAFFAINLAGYAGYQRFDHWSFLRFLLPSIPFLLLAAATGASAVMVGRSLAARIAVLTFVLGLFPFAYVHSAAKGDAFALKDLFRRRFADVGAAAIRALPANAEVLSILESGSLRYYSNRQTLRFDYVPPDTLDALLSYLRSRGFGVYAALTDDEMAQFATRFGPAIAARARTVSRPAEDVTFLRLDLPGAVGESEGRSPSDKTNPRAGNARLLR